MEGEDERVFEQGLLGAPLGGGVELGDAGLPRLLGVLPREPRGVLGLEEPLLLRDGLGLLAQREQLVRRAELALLADEGGAREGAHREDAVDVHGDGGALEAEAAQLEDPRLGPLADALVGEEAERGRLAVLGLEVAEPAQRVGAVRLDGGVLDGGGARAAVAVEGLLAVGGVLRELLLDGGGHGREGHVARLRGVLGRGVVRQRRGEHLEGQVDVGHLVALLVEGLELGGEAQVLLAPRAVLLGLRLEVPAARHLVHGGEDGARGVAAPKLGERGAHHAQRQHRGAAHAAARLEVDELLHGAEDCREGRARGAA